MDLFEDYDLLPEELKAVCEYWQEKAAHFGLDYNDCRAFQEECEAIGYTFDYGLDAEPFDLRPMSMEQQHHNKTIASTTVKNDLSWYDKYIVPLTPAYKDFLNEMEYTSPEIFFRDGERKFSDRERKFIQIHNYKNGINKVSDLKTLINEKENQSSINYGLSVDNFSRVKEIEYQTIDIEGQIQNFNNQNQNIMETQKDFDQVKYLKDQMKYLGFGEGEQLHKDLEKGINAKKQQFEIKTSSDKVSSGNQVDFTLKFNKSERGGIFLNSYHAKLVDEDNEERSHNFQVSRERSFTAKEAINLLEGRSVKIEFLNPKTEQIEPAFAQFDFNQPKTDKGNYYFQNFYKNYGVDTDKIVEKADLIFDKPEWKENAIKSLEKGNIVKVKFKQDDLVIEGKAVLDPQNRNLKLYDNDMNRLNSNKPLEGLEQDNKHEKNNVKEQSIKR